MFPLYDSTPRRTFPYINYLIIAVNIYLFWLELSSSNPEGFIRSFSFIPSQFSFLDINRYIPVFTSLFIHGSILHILSNLWFLHIFGDNVEDRIGHLKYLIFYLAGGMVATLAQYFLDPSNSIPVLGASGAISAVAGAYFIFYRRSTVKTLLPLFFFITFVDIPVWLFLGYWFLIQIFSSIGSLTTMAVQDGGVAWFAHIGGFLFGLFYARIIRPRYEVETGEIIS